MDETRADSAQERNTPEATMSRRGLFGRALVIATAGTGLMALAGCPGGDGDDDDDDDDDDD
ncbi:hypothetical protein ACQPZX_26000 [Actinoplanes sp. CA-142083]|uniref:hypothetical protein n=1 Tax=Actinoplanes sp. CA-142083 TaxID=3239903 RepID=UPI003D8EEF60